MKPTCAELRCKHLDRSRYLVMRCALLNKTLLRLEDDLGLYDDAAPDKACPIVPQAAGAEVADD